MQDAPPTTRISRSPVKRRPEKLSPHHRFALLLALSVWSGLYLFVWLYLDPAARYHSFAPPFSTASGYWISHLGRMGGLIEYASAWLAQWEYHPWLGAAVVVGLLGLSSAGTARVLNAADGRLGPAGVFPALVLLGLYARYEPGVLTIALRFLLAIGFLIVWLRIGTGPLRRELTFLPILGLPLFYLAGLLPSVFFLIAAGLLTVVRSLGLMKSRPSSFLAQTGVAAWLSPAVLGVGMIVALALSFDPDRRALLRIQSEAERGNWPGVLQAATQLRHSPPPARLQIQRALYHTGRLTSDLFCFPQHHGSDLLGSLADGLEICLPLCDTLLELGHVNLAERYAHEAWEIEGNRPQVMWRLARINLIKERPEAARVFFNLLARIPFHRDRAQRWLGLIDVDPTFVSHPEIAPLRARLGNASLAEMRFSTETLLRNLLEPNRSNAMAADYLLAHFLLTRQPAQIAEIAGLNTRPASDPLPRHIAEALLSLNPEAGTAELHAGQINPEITLQLRQFRADLTRQRASGSGAEAALAPAFGETYWFYEIFGHNAPRAATRSGAQR